jgi:Plavaka transposase
VEDLYATIDTIQVGSTPFQTIKIECNRPLPESNIPLWMTAEYELCVRMRDRYSSSSWELKSLEAVCGRVCSQGIGCGAKRYVSDHVGAKLSFSLYPQDQIYKADPSTQGSMLIPIVSGLDKTTVSVATGHQEFHPFYLSAGT